MTEEIENAAGEQYMTIQRKALWKQTIEQGCLMDSKHTVASSLQTAILAFIRFVSNTEQNNCEGDEDEDTSVISEQTAFQTVTDFNLKLVESDSVLISRLTISFGLSGIEMEFNFGLLFLLALITQGYTIQVSLTEASQRFFSSSNLSYSTAVIISGNEDK